MTVTSPETVADQFIRQHTSVGSAPLVPEFSLLLAQDVMTLWRATEILSGKPMPPPYWGFIWPGGQALARYILDHPEEVSGKSVLDFGAGCGLVSLSAARAGAKRIDAADIDAMANAACTRNAALNGLFLNITSENLIGAENDWQTILVGDMCYERPLAEALTRWLRTLAKRGVRVLLSDPGRNYFPPSGVVRLATYSVPTLLDLEDREIRETSVYALQSEQ